MWVLVSANRKCHATLLSSGQRADAAECYVATYAKFAEDATSLLVAQARVVRLHAVHAVGLEVEGVHVVLRKGAHAHVLVDDNLPLLRCEFALQHLQQRALPRPIGTENP